MKNDKVLNVSVEELLREMHHVFIDRITPERLVNDNIARIWKNCTLVALLAQGIADPHGKSALAKLSANVVRLSADCKADLGLLLDTPLLSPSKAMRYTKRAVRHYTDMRDAARALGIATGTHWGKFLHLML
ncbi:MAG: hypothetical protein ACRD3E_11010 [Terriglobales bacterium]